MRLTTSLCALLVASTAADVAGQGSFPDLPSRVFPVGDHVHDFVTADFDENGRADYAVALASGSIAIELSATDGAPIPFGTFPAAPFAKSLHTADFDGDGHADLAGYLPGLSGTLSVWRGDGLGGFAAPLTSTSAKACTTIEPADIDGDGDLDFYGLATRVQVWRNDGTGQMSFVGESQSNLATVDLVVADWNADGRDDWAASLNNGSVWIALADGNGGFGSYFTIPTALGSPLQCLVATDGNGDGLVDLVGATETFADSPASLHCLAGDGLGQVGAPTTMTSVLPTLPVGMVARDLDADGSTELIAADVVEGAIVFEPMGGSKWARGAEIAPLNHVDDVEVADVNGDGALDIASLVFGTPAIGVTFGVGDGSFDTALALGSEIEVRGLAVRDLDGDGRDDIVAADDGQAALYVFRSNAAGGFDGPTIHPAQISPRTPALGDIDGDGDIDALVPHELTTSVSYLAGNGQGGFGTPVFFAVGGKSLAALLDDVDGDGDLDGVLALDGPAGVRVLFGSGTGTFVGGPIVSTIASPTRLVGGDFDGDGDLDLAIASSKTASAAVHLGDGTGAFGAPLALPVTSGIAELLLADLDGDGRDDLIAASLAQRVDVFFGTGGGTFTAPATVALAGPRGLGAADIDSDGDDDLYVAEEGRNVTTLVLGDPSRAFSAKRSFSSGVESARHLAVGRFGAANELGFVAAANANAEPSIAVAIPSVWSGAPSLYCTAKTNSLGCVPSVGFSGTPSVSASSGFTIAAHGVLNQKAGLFFYSLAGPNAAPFLGGTYCVKPPTKRTAVQTSGGNPPPVDCSGTYSIDFNAYMSLGSDPNLVPGTTVRGQFWSRDPGFSTPNNVGFTSAIRFTLGF